MFSSIKTQYFHLILSFPEKLLRSVNSEKEAAGWCGKSLTFTHTATHKQHHDSRECVEKLLLDENETGSQRKWWCSFFAEDREDQAMWVSSFYTSRKELYEPLHNALCQIYGKCGLEFFTLNQGAYTQVREVSVSVKNWVRLFTVYRTYHLPTTFAYSWIFLKTSGHLMQ